MDKLWQSKEHTGKGEVMTHSCQICHNSPIFHVHQKTVRETEWTFPAISTVGRQYFSLSGLIKSRGKGRNRRRQVHQTQMRGVTAINIAVMLSVVGKQSACNRYLHVAHRQPWKASAANFKTQTPNLCLSECCWHSSCTTQRCHTHRSRLLFTDSRRRGLASRVCL